MKGIILAGGSGTRLSPLTRLFNKQLLPVGRYPMICHPLVQLLRADIRDIVIITNPEHVGDFATLLGSGEKFGANLTYCIQEKAQGIAQALNAAKPVLENDMFVMILGDNMFLDNLGPYFRKCQVSNQDRAHVFLKQVDDPERYGIAEIRGDCIQSIEEKPASPKSSYAVTGIYVYPPSVFRILDTISPSTRGEYEITDVNNMYISKGLMRYEILQSYWVDAGTFSSLLEANQLMHGVEYPELSGLFT